MKDEIAQAVVIERTFNAPIGRVWQALTDVDQMREWYFDLKEFKPRVGFQFEFTVQHGGTTYRHLCRVTDTVPEKKIAYSWRYDGQPGDSLVTFELFPEGTKTRLKLTHEGLETFPRTADYARTKFEAGWTSLSNDLQKFVENETQPA